MSISVNIASMGLNDCPGAGSVSQWESSWDLNFSGLCSVHVHAEIDSKGATQAQTIVAVQCSNIFQGNISSFERSLK